MLMSGQKIYCKVFRQVKLPAQFDDWKETIIVIEYSKCFN